MNILLNLRCSSLLTFFFVNCSIFLNKIFPVGDMKLKIIFRILEQLTKKKVNDVDPLRFSKICIKENLLPNYIDEYVPIHF